MKSRISSVVRILDVLCAELVSLSRLHALSLLAEGSMQARLDIARRSVTVMESAAYLNTFLRRYASLDLIRIAWSTQAHPANAGILTSRSLDQKRLLRVIHGQSRFVAELISELLETAGSSGLLLPWRDAAQRVADSISVSPDDTRGQRSHSVATPPPPNIMKVVEGPISVPLDAIFKKSYGLLEVEPPEFGDSLRETVPYLWVLASRESLAAELAALCMIEWDGLPLDFYLDFSKQMWDECRHAVFCLETALSLIDDLQSQLTSQDPLFHDVLAYRAQTDGLPIPREGNLYEVILNASLVERLVLMHHDTETPGIANLQRQMESRLWLEHPEIAEGIAIVQVDERTHARLGHRWLRYLLPDMGEREAAISDARLFRSVFLLACVAQHGEQKLEELLREAISKCAPRSEIIAY